MITTKAVMNRNEPSYRPNKRPGRVVPRGKEDIR